MKRSIMLDNYSRRPSGHCILFGLEFKLRNSRKWHKCSLTMHDAKKIAEQAELLRQQNGWSDWRIVDIV